MDGRAESSQNSEGGEVSEIQPAADTTVPDARAEDQISQARYLLARDAGADDGRPLYFRNCHNTSDPDEVAALLEYVCEQEKRAFSVPQLLFPQSRLATRACYIFNVGADVSRGWDFQSGRVRYPAPRQRFNQVSIGVHDSQEGLFSMVDHRSLRSSHSPPKLLLRQTPMSNVGVGEDDNPGAVDQIQADERAREARLLSALETMVKAAQKDGAAILVVDYFRDSDATALLSRALSRCDFQGPIVAVEGASNLPPPRAPTSHVFVVNNPSHTASRIASEHSRFAAALANAISGRSSAIPKKLTRQPRSGPSGSQSQTDGRDGKRPFQVCGVLSGGGAVVMRHMGEHARQGIPYVVLEGSGGLADVLSSCYLQRSSAAFDVYRERLDTLWDGPDAGPMSSDDNATMDTILGGRLLVHKLSNGRASLQRLLECAFAGTDSALDLARRRCAEYQAAAGGLGSQDSWVHRLYLLLAVTLTVMAALFVEIAPENECADETADEIADDSACCDFRRQKFSGCHWLHYVLIVLPLVSSLVLCLRVAQNSAGGSRSYAFAAALVERAVFQYQTRSGPFADLAVAEDARTTGSNLDVVTHRADMLNQLLVTVRDKYLADMPRAVAPAGATKPPAGGGQGVSAAFSDRTRGDEYLRVRVQPQRVKWMREEARLSRYTAALQALSFLCGGAGTILVLFGLEVWLTVTTAFLAAAAALHAPVADRVGRAQAAARALDDIAAAWSAVPGDKKTQQYKVEALVGSAERAIMDAFDHAPSSAVVKQNNAAAVVPVTQAFSL